MKCFVVCLLALAAVVSSQSGTVYISPTGNDKSGAGTQSSPWQTLSRAGQANPATIYMLGGVYTGANNQLNVSSGYVAVTAYNNSNVILNTTAPFVLYQNGSLTITGLTIESAVFGVNTIGAAGGYLHINNCNFLANLQAINYVGTGSGPKTTSHVSVANSVFNANVIAIQLKKANVDISSSSFTFNTLAYSATLANTNGINNVFASNAFGDERNVGTVLISGGTYNDVGSTYFNNTVQENGGAIFGSSPSLVNLTSVGFEQNSAFAGGAIYIAAEEANGILNVYNSTFTFNSATSTEPQSGNGGAIYLSGLTVATFLNTSFIGNTAIENGGAIFMYEVINSLITSCAFEKNNAVNGGGIASSTSGGTVLLSAFESNLAIQDGGGIWIKSASFPGTVFTVTNTAFLTNSAAIGGGLAAGTYTNFTSSNNLFEQNYASCTGGGLHVAIYSDEVNIYNSTIIGNTITGNQASNVCNGTVKSDVGAGGLSIVGGSVIVRDSLISKNSGQYGGNIGLYTAGFDASADGPVFVLNSTISSGSATLFGAGIYARTAYINLTLSDCDVILNNATSGGGIYWVSSLSQLLVQRSMVSMNSAQQTGGAFFCSASNSTTIPTFVDSVIENNKAFESGGAAECTPGCPVIDYSNTKQSGNTAPNKSNCQFKQISV